MNTNNNLLVNPPIKKKITNLLYNLEYWIGNKHESTVMYNKTSSQCFGMGRLLKETDSRYKLGTFKNKEVC